MKQAFTLLLTLLLTAGLCACAAETAAPPSLPRTDRTSVTDTAADPVTDAAPAKDTVYTFTTRTQSLRVDGKLLYGVLYLPQKADKLPLVILSHGLGGTSADCAAGAEALAAHGVAAYFFDFRGGGAKSKSEGSSLQMSVMTEVADLEAVLSAAKTWEFVDPERIALFGGSQGGIVSAIVAARHRDEINGLMLWFPAFVIPDLIRATFPDAAQTPAAYTYGGFTLGRVYADDVRDYDPYTEIAQYDKPVLIVHGTADLVVPISYSRHAAEVYPDAELHEIAGAGHGFTGARFDEATAYALQYLQTVGILVN